MDIKGTSVEGKIITSPAHSLSDSDDGHMRYKRQLVLSNIPANVRDVEYAVRGAVVLRALAIQHDLALNKVSYPFSKMTFCNIGNPQEVGQPPLTHLRQMVTLVTNPKLLSTKNNEILQYPRDIRKRSKKYVRILHSSGAYTHSKGALEFREMISGFFERRDGHACDPESIFLTDGASSAVNSILQFLVGSKNSGVMIPIPQYPLYNATLTLLSGSPIPYYLDEEKNWGLSRFALEDAVTEARVNGIQPEAIVIINPGNPSGAVLSEADMIEVIEFCERESIVIIADEVYQDNIYSKDKSFISFRKLIRDRKSPVQLVSLHSASKGYYGECGHRAGLMQLENVDQEVLQCIYKLQSVKLCANTIGQAIITTILNPPEPGDPSHALFIKEKNTILGTLEKRSQMVYTKLNSMEGVSCQPIEGALYAFPKITIPPKAIQIAQEKNVQPDLMYSMELLEETGLVVVPGSGFGQRPGTYHLRLTLLPNTSELSESLDKMKAFNEKFLSRYS